MVDCRICVYVARIAKGAAHIYARSYERGFIFKNK